MEKISLTSENEGRRIRRRDALVLFFKENEGKLISINRWAKESHVAERTIGQLLDGSRRKNMRTDTYERLCIGASILLGRQVYIYELTGEKSDSAILSSRAERLLDSFNKLPEKFQDLLISHTEETLKALSK